MAIKRVYVSDLTGKEIEGAHKTISINKTVTKKYNYGYGRARTYRSSEAKVFHLSEDEIKLLPKAIRDYLFPPKAEKEDTPEEKDSKPTRKSRK